MRAYSCMAVENPLEALCFVRSPRATHASCAMNPRPSGLVELDLAESLRSWRCTQPRATKATAGVAVVGKMASIPRAVAIVRYTLLTSGARNAPR